MRRTHLAAAQLCCAGLVAATAAAGDWPGAWSDLWRTPDQQGQALLAAGEPAQAAARFQDPRRRAYAYLQARRYGDAASLLAPFDDSESEYNRGNALAAAGQLQAALAAYDAALKLAPADADIRHNRDLVARALQQPSPQGRPGPQRPGARGQQTPNGRPGANGSQAGADQPGGSGQRPNAPQAAAARREGNSKDGTDEARRDAAFAAANARGQRPQRSPGQTQSPDAGSLAAGGAQTPKQQPESERQLMLDQWLRQIPDSPAGLLQRQFLLDHMTRQQGGSE